jgi:uncharacterized glyoxalase superfamily protein PhnB
MADLPQQTQRVIPYLFYKNGKAAIDFLAKAFGFEARLVMPGPGDSVMHAELGLGDNVVYLGTPDAQIPAGELPMRHAAVLVYVDDVDEHCARARHAGAKIESDPADQFYGDRTYNARDPEGQLWYFHKHVRDVSPEEMQAAMASMSARPEGSAPPAPKKAKKRVARASKPRAKRAAIPKRKRAAPPKTKRAKHR